MREDSFETFRRYTEMVDDETRPHTLRGVLEFAFDRCTPVPLDEVEPAEEIVRRFKTGAMSYGSISQEAHECLAEAMNRLGGQLQFRRGRRAPRAPEHRPGARRSSRWPRGRFGVTSEYLMSAEEIQIKMAQGAKPGEGGHLPGGKVYPWVAHTRCSTPGVSLISPPPHHDIYSIEDLAQLIYDLKCANRRARISVKLVSEAGVGTVAAGVAKAGAQVILDLRLRTAAPARPRARSIHNAGLPWELGVAEAHQTLVAERPAQPRGHRGRRQADERPGRGRGLHAGRGGVRLRHRAAGVHGLRDDARVQSGHLPGGHRHPEPRAAQALQGQARVRNELHAVHRPRSCASIMARLGVRTRGRAGGPRRSAAHASRSRRAIAPRPST